MYSEDPVGKAIEENYLGQNGVYTGQSASNAFGYSDYLNKQNQPNQVGYTAGSRGSALGNLRIFIVIGLSVWAYVQTGSWATTGIVCGVSFISVMILGRLLKAFLRTWLGRLVNGIIQTIITLTALAFIAGMGVLGYAAFTSGG
ncbi:MAG: hypothetical protein AAGH53_04840 [Pseudomonadota bacterium]